MDLDQYISTITQYHFPEFYQEDGATFVTFVKAYYEWMEQEGYVTNASRNLLNYKDVDTTVSQFTDRFKSEFLLNFPASTAANQDLLVKKIKDFYSAKGSIQGMQLLFRLLFKEDITVYDPGTDIIKASDGVWKIPIYLEVEHNPRSRTFINQQITGSLSGATAFVESIHTKIINSRLIDIINVSSVLGSFRYGELITNDGDLTNAPKIVGSLTSINITDGGANNQIGDLYDITSSTNGLKGSARVIAVANGTGRVSFTLIDGGSGYTTNSSQIHVSNTILFTSNRTSSGNTTDYTTFDYVVQPLALVSYTVSTPTNPTDNDLYHLAVTGYNGSNVAVANGFIVASNDGANTIVINVTGGNFSNATKIHTTGNTVQITGYSLSNATAEGIITGSNSSAVGLHSITNTFYGNGAFVTSNVGSYVITANVDSISTGSGAGFQIGSLTDTETVSIFTDFIAGVNSSNTPYLNLVINTASYGFPKNTSAGYSNTILSALGVNTFTIGSISSLSSINPGTNYNANPFVAIRNPYIAGYQRKELLLEVTNKSGAFAIGDTISQTYTESSKVVTYNANVGAFTVGEGLTQSNGSANAYGTINSVNATAMVLTGVTGTFRSNTGGGQALRGLISGSTANSTAVTSNTVSNLARGIIVELPSSDTILIKRRTFNEAIQIGSTITATSGGTANVVDVMTYANSAPMGLNAVVNSYVTTAKGIVTKLEIMDSGYGHQPNDILELTNTNNPFAITGVANVYHQGIGIGYWMNNRGKLNSDKFIIDDEYYQDFSYEIQSRLSLDKYADVLKRIAHVAGTKLFGKVIIGLSKDMPFNPIPANIQVSS